MAGCIPSTEIILNSSRKDLKLISSPTSTDAALWRGSYGLFPFPSSTLEGSILNTWSWWRENGFKVWSCIHFVWFMNSRFKDEISGLRGNKFETWANHNVFVSTLGHNLPSLHQSRQLTFCQVCYAKVSMLDNCWISDINIHLFIHINLLFWVFSCSLSRLCSHL